MTTLSRRKLIKVAALAAPLNITSLGQLMGQTSQPARACPSDAFPSHPAEMVHETVLVAHFNPKRLKELVDRRPALARAAWDWGFGDWEDALGAASHMGNRPIAEYLLSMGARPTLFSAAMLGQLETVQTFVKALPGCQRIQGPHSISLLAHAKAGGSAAQPVFDYLQSLGDAGAKPEAPLSEHEGATILGSYLLNNGKIEEIQVTRERNGFPKDQIVWTRKGAMGRPLYHLGNRVFFPAGAAEVRIQFAEQHGSTIMTVIDGDFTMSAPKSSS